MPYHSITRACPDIDLEQQSLYLDENYHSCGDTCTHRCWAKDSDKHSQFCDWLFSYEQKEWHQSDLEVAENVPETAVYGGLIQDVVWCSPVGIERSADKACVYDCFDLNTQYELEGFIDEENLLLGIPTEHVPRPSQFITVETESWDQLVPHLPTCRSSDDDLLQVVPLIDGYSNNGEDQVLAAVDLADNYQLVTENGKFCCPHSCSTWSDKEDFSLVPQLDIPIYNNMTAHSPMSSLTEGSDNISSPTSSLFDIDSDILSDGYDDMDRPVNSCSAQDFSVSMWAVEE